MNAQVPRKMMSLINNEWLNKNVLEKISKKKTNYNIFIGKLDTQNTLATSLKEYKIEKKLNDRLNKMALLCNNGLDEDFTSTQIVSYLTLWLLNTMTTNYQLGDRK